MSEGPSQNCEFYENYENYKTCENSQDPRGTQREIRLKTAKIRKGTKNCLQDARGTQRELRILRKLRELR